MTGWRVALKCLVAYVGNLFFAPFEPPIVFVVDPIRLKDVRHLGHDFLHWHVVQAKNEGLFFHVIRRLEFHPRLLR